MLITTVFGGKNDYQTLEFLTTENLKTEFLTTENGNSNYRKQAETFATKSFEACSISYYKIPTV
ncbi:hypothetical protein ACKUZO_020920 [Acinetobacter baumannii]